MPPLHQHRESSFRRYENILSTAITFYPVHVEFHKNSEHLKGLPDSLQTICARCRDAKNALLLNLHWQTTIDKKKLLLIKDDLQMTIRGDVLLIGDKQSLRETRPTLEDLNPSRDEPIISDSLKRVDGTMFHGESLSVLLLLAKKSWLKYPIQITLEDEKEADLMEEIHEVAILRENGKFFLLP